MYEPGVVVRALRELNEGFLVTGTGEIQALKLFSWDNLIVGAGEEENRELPKST